MLRAGRPALGTLGADYLGFKFCDVAICTKKRHISISCPTDLVFQSAVQLKMHIQMHVRPQGVGSGLQLLTNDRYSLKEHR